MVSTHTQYLSDYNSPIISNMDTGKSPLAMLAKTCETIGLPDTPNRKSNKDEKTKDNSSPSSSSSTDGKKDAMSPTFKKKEGSKSPRHAAHSPLVGKKTPITSEPSTSTATLPTNLMLSSRCFPMGFSPLAPGFPTFPYPSLMPGFPAVPAFASAFPSGTANPFLRCPDPLSCKGCSASMMTRPCVTPGCTSCTVHSAGATPADMMMAFPSSFFASYNPLMTGAIPPTTSSAAQVAYQNLMAAASGQTAKHICNFLDSPNGICGKVFSTADELANHMKVAHTTLSSVTSASNDLKSNSPRSTSSSSNSTPLIAHTSLRYHPYLKPGNLMPAVPNPLSVPQYPAMPAFPSAAALQAMYTQRLMATMPHP